MDRDSASLYPWLGAAVLAVAVAAWLAHRWRQARLRQQADHELDRLKSDFLARTSHELRAPLFGIVGLAESLIEGAAGQLSEMAKIHLAMIAASGRRLTSLVADMADVSRLERNSLSLDLQPVDLRSLADVVLTLSQPLVGGKDLRLSNAIPEDAPPVWGDERRLEQVLHNLVDNAIRFTVAGKVEITARVEEGERGDRLVVGISDTGIGIGDADREAILQNSDPASRGHYAGTGLGLALTRQLVELHGGSLWVDSTLGQGSTFSFSLPVAPPGLPAPPAPRPVPAPLTTTLDESWPSTPEGEARILIVDDEPVSRQVLANQLSRQGYHLRQATNGEDALELLAKHSVDLVLLDVVMPKMSGYEVCRKLRERFTRQELAVIFLTGKSEPADLVTGFVAGANDYLRKPVAKEELLARVATHLELQKAHRSLERMVAERTSQLAERDGLFGDRDRLIAELEARNAELGRINYTISHDLKNPLVTIKTYLGSLRRETAGDKAGDAKHLLRDLESIGRAADEMREILDALYEYSRIGEEDSRSLVTTSLSDLAREASVALAEPLGARGFEVTIAPGLPHVFGERRRLIELFRTLFDNAIKFIGDQPAPRIEVGLREDKAGRVVYVRDNGIGVPPRYHEKVFGLFDRLDSRSEGRGIGLALARRIVEHHGGRMWMESEGKGRGSTFCFTVTEAAAPYQSS